jgi:hypothetical protein
MWSWSSTEVVAALLLVAAPTAACTKTESGGPSSGGSVAVGDIEGTVVDAECAQPGDTLFASGVSVLDDDRVVIFDVQVEGERGDATVRTLRGDEVDEQHVAADVRAQHDDDRYTVDGTFTAFDGPTQLGDVEGTIEFSCEADTDPGGGFVALDGQQVDYDLVTCVETDTAYEARARVTSDPTQVLTASRALLRSGWIDHLTATGSVALDQDRDLSQGDPAAIDPADAGPAVDADGGLFAVRGARVTAEGDAFGDEHVGSMDLTCGIDISTLDAG